MLAAHGFGYTQHVFDLLSLGTSDAYRVVKPEARRETRLVPFALALVSAGAAPEICAGAARFMHARELLAFSELRSERRQQSFALGRFSAKLAVHALGTSGGARDIEIAAGVFGQPLLKGLENPPALTLTHTEHGAAALAAEPEHIVGIDLERLADERRAVFERAMTPRELQSAANLRISEAANAGVFWTLKEALSKALRCGLTVPFSVLEIDSIERHEDGGLICRFINFTQYHGRCWTFGGHALAIVLPKWTQLALTETERGALTLLSIR